MNEEELGDPYDVINSAKPSKCRMCQGTGIMPGYTQYRHEHWDEEDWARYEAQKNEKKAKEVSSG